MRLCELRPLYQQAYDRLRYVRRARLPEHFARLCVQRLLDRAWALLLEMPAPLAGEGVIVMASGREHSLLADCQGFSPHTSECAMTMLDNDLRAPKFPQ